MAASQSQGNFFVVAAIVAAELDKAQRVAREISLTASNARALAQRAGQGAAGFRAITDYIDELASKTVLASQKINSQSISISRVASASVDAETALQQFERVYRLAKEAAFIDSVDAAYSRIRQRCEELRREFNKLVWQLNVDLEELARELRTATVLSAMSRVEASHSGKQHEQSLNVIAANVASAAENINRHVKTSRHLFSAMNA